MVFDRQVINQQSDWPELLRCIEGSQNGGPPFRPFIKYNGGRKWAGNILTLIATFHTVGRKNVECHGDGKGKIREACGNSCMLTIDKVWKLVLLTAKRNACCRDTMHASKR